MKKGKDDIQRKSNNQPVWGDIKITWSAELSEGGGTGGKMYYTYVLHYISLKTNQDKTRQDVSISNIALVMINDHFKSVNM